MRIGLPALLFSAIALTFFALTALAYAAPQSSASKRSSWIEKYVANYKTNKRSGKLTPKQCENMLRTARGFVKNKLRYDPSYFKISFPNGDVPSDSGVCTDVVVRAARVAGVDLQKLVNEDIIKAKSAYPPLWNLAKPDSNIDHRRVPNLLAWFERHGNRLELSRKPEDYQPCDIVACELEGGVTHIGLVTDKKSADGIPLLIHHFGGRLPAEEDILMSWRMIGHFSVRLFHVSHVR